MMNTSQDMCVEGGINAPTFGPRRLRRVAGYGRRLGLAGVSYADAIDAVEGAVWADGALPADTPRRRQAWQLTLDAALTEWREGARDLGRAQARKAVAAHIEAMRMPVNPFDDTPVGATDLPDLELQDFDAAYLIETAAMAANIPAEDIVEIVGEVCPLPRNALRVAEFALNDFQRVPARNDAIAREVAEGTYKEETAMQVHQDFTAWADEIAARGNGPSGEIAELAQQSRAWLAGFPPVPNHPAPAAARSADELALWIDRLGDLYGMSASEAQAALRRLRLGVKSQDSSRSAPVDLWQRHEAPDLPIGLLPEVIERFAFAHGEIMGADPAGLAMSALAVCAAAINDEVCLQVKQHDPSWRESARLWVGLVGMPSTKKTPIMNAAMRPLRRLDASLAARNDEAMRRHRALPKVDQASVPQPKQPRHVVEDATVESLQQILADSPHGVISIQDELTGWFGLMEKYNPGKGAGADRAFYLKSYNGGAYSVSRVMRGSALIPNLSIGLLGGIQPEPMRKLAGDTVDDGLIQRFLPVMLKSATAGLDAPAGDAVAAYELLVARLARLVAPRMGNLDQGTPLVFSASARAVRERLEADHVSLVRALETVSPKLAAHFGKMDGIFARLCLLWHCVEHSEGALPLEVGCGTAERVAQFMTEFLRPSAVAFYAGLLGMSAGHEDLMALAGIIVSESLAEISARDVQRSTRALRHVTADDARRLCEKLAAFGWLEPLEPRTKSHTPRWRVLPEVHGMFAARGRQEAERRTEAQAAFMRAFRA